MDQPADLGYSQTSSSHPPPGTIMSDVFINSINFAILGKFWKYFFKGKFQFSINKIGTHLKPVIDQSLYFISYIIAMY